MNRKEVEQRTILLALTGSHSYGLNTENSDKDYKGIFVAPRAYYLGLNSIEQKENGWDEEGIFSCLDNNKDVVIYELHKYIKLAANCNPNILELLFEDEKFYEYLDPDFGEILLANRDLFLSKKAKHSYMGYGFAQLKKIKTHRKWLLTPPTHKPTAEEFGLGVHNRPLTKQDLNAFLEFVWTLIKDRIEYLEEEKELYSFLQERVDIKGALKVKNTIMSAPCYDYLQKITGSSDEYMARLTKTQQYNKALDHWKSYISWKENRNKVRAELERKAGFDCKHGAHALRLLTMGCEILKGEGVKVNRKGIDADYLLAIRQGHIPYEEVITKADKLYKDLDNLYDNSPLPHKVNYKAIDNLLITLVSKYHAIEPSIA